MAAALQHQQQQAGRDRQRQAAEAKEQRAKNVACSVLASGSKANEHGRMSYLSGDCRCSTGQALFPIACQHHGAQGFSGPGSDRRFNKAPIVGLRNSADYSMLHPAILKDKDEFDFPSNFPICHCEESEASFDEKWIYTNIPYRRFLEGNSELHSWKSGGGETFSKKLEHVRWLDGCDTQDFKESAIWTCILKKRRFDAYMPQKFSVSTGKFKGLQIVLKVEGNHYTQYKLGLKIEVVGQDSKWSVYDEDRPTHDGLDIDVGSLHEASRSKKQFSVTADVVSDARKPYTAIIDLKIPMRKELSKHIEIETINARISIDVSSSKKQSTAMVAGDEATIEYRNLQLPF